MRSAFGDFLSPMFHSDNCHLGLNCPKLSADKIAWFFELAYDKNSNFFENFTQKIAIFCLKLIGKWQNYFHRVYSATSEAYNEIVGKWYDVWAIAMVFLELYNEKHTCTEVTNYS